MDLSKLADGIFTTRDGREIPFGRLSTPILLSLLKRARIYRDRERALSSATAHSRAELRQQMIIYLRAALVARGVAVYPDVQACCLCEQPALRLVGPPRQRKGYCAKHTAQAFLARRLEILRDVHPKADLIDAKRISERRLHDKLTVSRTRLHQVKRRRS